jgi:long-subunit fatty acid transport protein
MYYTLDGAYELAPWLSVGGGASFVHSRVRQNSKLNSNYITLANLGPPGMPDANTETDVEGNGTGWNLGVLATPNDKFDIGFFYRSEVRVPLRGTYDADNLQGPVMTAIFGGNSFHTSADTDITFPDSAVLGVNYKATDKLNLEVDLGWTGWGKFDHFDFTYGTTNAVLNAGDPSQNKFRDAYSVNVGADYKLNSNWDVLAGYAYYERAALEEDYSSVFQDGDRHSVAVGLQYHVKNLTIGLAYSAQFVTDMHVDNNVGSINNVSVDGTYSNFYHVVVTSVTYKI